MSKLVQDVRAIPTVEAPAVSSLSVSMSTTSESMLGIVAVDSFVDQTHHITSSSIYVSLKFIYTLFFVSGFTALIYEVAWLNRIQLVMGHTVYSLSTTLTAYLCGLAVGSLFAARIKNVGLNTLFLYLIAEFIIGIYGLLFQPLLSLIEIPYNELASLVEASLAIKSFIQFIFCGGLIFVPTFLMGTTLPLLAHYLFQRQGELSKKISSLYATNTLGAAVGSFIAGFFILPNLGYSKTIQLAAVINILLFLCAVLTLSESIFVSRKALTLVQNDLRPFKYPVGTIIACCKYLCMMVRACIPRTVCLKEVRSAGIWGAILFVSGFVAMLSQLVWNRLASLVFGPSTFIFSLVTTVVLLGIVLGSLLYQLLSKTKVTSFLMLSILTFLGAFFFLIGNVSLSYMPVAMLNIHYLIAPGFWLLSFIELMLLSLCILPAATCLGSLFPAAVSFATQDSESERATNILSMGYTLNILGLIVAALVGSFFLVPHFGIEFTHQLVFGTLLLIGVCLLFKHRYVFIVCPAVLILAFIIFNIIPGFQWNLLTSGYFYNRANSSTQEENEEKGYFSRSAKARMDLFHLIAHRDDPHATVSIHKNPERKDHLIFKINGKVDGGTGGDLSTTRLLALIPMLYKIDVKSSLVIGLGTGSTAGMALKFPQIQKVKVIELSEAMIDYSKIFFTGTDGNLWNDKRFQIENRDGRDFLKFSDEKFDMIISEPSNPWVDGVGSLFTEEYYRLILDRLSSNGIAVLWFHAYGLECPAVHGVFSAVAQVFPSVFIFKTSADIYMIASRQELKMNMLPVEFEHLEKMLFDELDIPYNTSNRLQAYQAFLKENLLYDRSGIERLSTNTTINTDDNQYLQFASGKSFFTSIRCRDFPYAQNKGH